MGTGLYDIPNSRQTVCYVINDWTFSSKTDNTGTRVGKPTKLSVFKRPAETIYLADNEAGSWRPIIESATSRELIRCDIFMRTHLPLSENHDIKMGNESRASGTGKAAMSCTSTGTPPTSPPKT
jgi:hypothetical protein